jgi:long-chain acyl-CoA synthetase
MQLQNTTTGEDSNFNLIGMYAKNCEGWVVCDYGCFMTSVALVTLYDTLGAESSEYIIEQ